MPNREEALRRIFEATGVSARLTEDQKRELLAHVEDAVEAKVAAGVSEVEAVGQAFTELGDLEKIARQYPKEPPAAVTPEGVRVVSEGRSLLWIALAHLAFFSVLSAWIVPKFAEVFRQVKVPLPGLTLLFLNFGDFLRSHPGVLLAVLVLIGAAMRLVRKRRISPVLSGALLVLVAGLSVGLVAALFLPLISLLEGIR